MYSGYLPLILLYPEIHYRFRYLRFSKYYLKEPEVLIDMPYKTLNNNIPVFLIIKDADLFPILLWAVKFHFLFEDGSAFIKTFLIGEKINSKNYFQEFEFVFEEKNGFVRVSALIQTYINGSYREIVNDNFIGINSDFEVFLADDEELFENYIQGDLHYHSEFTTDQVEFGSPVLATRRCAESLGLNFFALTDHSYDLDDEFNNYFAHDPELKKYEAMKQSCIDNSNEKVTILPGEEITVRNNKQRNVHLIAYDDEFFYGRGDSAEEWFKTRSGNSISDVTDNLKESSLAIAAHPFNKTPLLEYLLVKRGVWSTDDITKNNISHIQILNGDFDENFFAGLTKWIKLLLKGEKIFIVAGSDAHGNFNVFRQIKFPMFRLISKNKQIFGKCRTVIFSESNDKNAVISGLKSGNIYITNGPHILLNIDNGDKIYDIGNTFVADSGDMEAELYINSSKYSGSIKAILLYRGSIHSYNEKIIWKKEFIETIYNYSERIPLINDKIDHYIRLEVFTSSTNNNGKRLEHRAYSNPIWIIE
ncbi:MAG: CehA/McbA family metallohydrolase [Candidatus Delongbacteria bacterium]|nr:CehA/McbA family metallohydrolase [Candidatus Delongbacteria bacterium]MCG2761086.1 CehA/McbA family metallohydrolase [Candidatus Delongbacteria bacterium]